MQIDNLTTNYYELPGEYFLAPSVSNYVIPDAVWEADSYLRNSINRLLMTGKINVDVLPAGYVVRDNLIIRAADDSEVDVSDEITRLVGRVSMGVGDTVSDSGATAAAPASGTTVASITAPPAGKYQVKVTVVTVGTAEATNRANMNLRRGTTVISDLPSTGVVTDHEFDSVTLNGSETINIVVGASAGSAGAVYVASIQATRIE